MESGLIWSTPHAYSQNGWDLGYGIGLHTEVADFIVQLPNECTVCVESFYTYKDQESLFLLVCGYGKDVSTEQTTNNIFSYAKSIERDREHLAKLLRSHGDVLIAKWAKKK